MKILRSTLLTCTLLGIVACGDDDQRSPTTPPGGSPPTASATASQSEGITLGAVAVLDGTASTDPDGDDLTFAWSLLSAPEGSEAELLGAADSIATIQVDVEGSYSAMLVVDDGGLTSTPDTVTVTAMRGPPRIAMDDFENTRTIADRTVVLEEMLTVTGAVDDPDATVTVNGTPAAVADQRYSADIALSPGQNDVVAVAENPAGQASVAESVTYIGPGTTLRISSPRALYGVVYESGAPVPGDLPVTVTGFATASLIAPTPSITVNGVPASVTETAASCVIVQCFRFEAELLIAKGPTTITAVYGTLTEAVTPTVDYCLKMDRHAGVASEIGGQGNRCHEIDGCSVYAESIGPIFDLRNNPMPLAVRNQASTEFGDGEVPPEEFFIHGKSPARALPCNRHDVCYQTIGTSQSDCDAEMYVDMQAVCFRAYPPDIIAPIERADCYAAAWVYYQGLRQWGGSAHSERQEEYGIG